MSQQTGASLLARHAAQMCTGFGSVPVAFGAFVTRGQFRIQTADAIDAEGFSVRLRTTTVRVPAAWVATLSGFAEGASVTVDGTAYQVRRVDPEDDGATTLVTLAES